jgi:hypothetical protein
MLRRAEREIIETGPCPRGQSRGNQNIGTWRVSTAHTIASSVSAFGMVAITPSARFESPRPGAGRGSKRRIAGSSLTCQSACGHSPL